MAVSLKRMGRKELEQLKIRIEKQLEKLAKSDLKAARSAAEKAAKQHGFSLGEVVGQPMPQRRKSKPRQKAVAKYAHPENSALTWSGRGRQPKWYKDYVDAGNDPSELSINKA